MNSDFKVIKDMQSYTTYGIITYIDYMITTSIGQQTKREYNI